MTGLATCSYREYRHDMGVPVRISLGRPRWWTTPIPESAFVSQITPRGWYLRSPECDYLAAYTEQLTRYGVDRIEARFSAISVEFGEPLVLLCFENLASKRLVPPDPLPRVLARGDRPGPPRTRSGAYVSLRAPCV